MKKTLLFVLICALIIPTQVHPMMDDTTCEKILPWTAGATILTGIGAVICHLKEKSLKKNSKLDEETKQSIKNYRTAKLALVALAIASGAASAACTVKILIADAGHTGAVDEQRRAHREAEERQRQQAEQNRQAREIQYRLENARRAAQMEEDMERAREIDRQREALPEQLETMRQLDDATLALRVATARAQEHERIHGRNILRARQNLTANDINAALENRQQELDREFELVPQELREWNNILPQDARANGNRAARRRLGNYDNHHAQLVEQRENLRAALGRREQVVTAAPPNYDQIRLAENNADQQIAHIEQQQANERLIIQVTNAEQE